MAASNDMKSPASYSPQHQHLFLMVSLHCWVEPGPAYNCMNLLRMATLTPVRLPMSRDFTCSARLHIYVNLLIAKVLLNLRGICQWHLSDLNPSVFASYSLKGESGPRGRRSQCCQRSLWLSSAWMRQLSWQPADVFEPPVFASPLRPMRRWTKSRRSSHGPAMAVLYQVSLMVKEPSFPLPAVSDRRRVGAQEEGRGKGGGEKGEERKDKNMRR